MKTKQSKGQRLGWQDRKHATKVLLNENMLTGVSSTMASQEYIDGLYAKSTEDKTTYQRLLKGNWDKEYFK